MKKPNKISKDLIASAINLIDQYFMNKWRHLHSAENFTRKGEECAMMANKHSVLSVTVFITGAILAIFYAILALPGAEYSPKFHLGLGVATFTTITSACFVWRAMPGKRILKAGLDWTYARSEAIRLEIVSCVANHINGVQGHNLGDTDLENAISRLLYGVADEMLAHEADGNNRLKKAAKTRFYAIYNFAKEKLGLQIPETGIYLQGSK